MTLVDKGLFGQPKARTSLYCSKLLTKPVLGKQVGEITFFGIIYDAFSLFPF